MPKLTETGRGRKSFPKIVGCARPARGDLQHGEVHGNQAENVDAEWQRSHAECAPALEGGAGEPANKHDLSGKLARAVGFEPTTNRLTADCSTAELRPNNAAGITCCEGAYLVAVSRRVN